LYVQRVRQRDLHQVVAGSTSHGWGLVAAAGSIVAWLLALGLNRLFLAVLHSQAMTGRGAFFLVTGWLVLLAFVPFVGVLAGLYPVDGATLLDPIDALRQE
jgi:ABC-type antimicrobial peptide transport system permease subunit